MLRSKLRDGKKKNGDKMVKEKNLKSIEPIEWSSTEETQNRNKLWYFLEW